MHVEHPLPKSSVVSSTRNAVIFEKIPSRAGQTPTLGSGSRRRGGGLYGQRLQMHSISSRSVQTKRQHFNNCTLRRASRARGMHIVKIKSRLAYAKCYVFFENAVSPTQNDHFGMQSPAEPSRTEGVELSEPSRAELSRAVPSQTGPDRAQTQSPNPIFFPPYFWVPRSAPRLRINRPRPYVYI